MKSSTLRDMAASPLGVPLRDGFDEIQQKRSTKFAPSAISAPGAVTRQSATGV